LEHSEQEQQEQVFGKLFGFKKGDRVKTRVTRIYGRGKYWKYMTVEAVDEESHFNYMTEKRDTYVRVHDNSDPQFSYMIREEELVRVRKYVRKKPK